MEKLHSYPSLFAIGHRATAELFDGPVIVEEKIDGSQFSFGISESGELMCRSKGVQIVLDEAGMFSSGVAAAKSVANLLKPGWTYRGEYLRVPKHNTLTYDRVPKNHVIIFDINTGLECYLGAAEKAEECARIGFEVVPLLYEGMIGGPHALTDLLNRTSVLGGPKIEGVVVKPKAYDKFGQDKKAIIGKFVSEDFKEKHSVEWKESNRGSGDILLTLGSELRSEARWAKAVQHLRDSGKLEGSPKDIGALIREVPADILKECAAEIQERLMKWAWPKIQRDTIRGLPEWYKQQLLEGQWK